MFSQDIYKSTYVDKVNDSQASHLQFSSALSGSPNFTIFSDNEVSANMELIAKTVVVCNTLEMTRHTFFVNFGGWDHHDIVLDNQAAMLGVLSKVLGEFEAALQQMGIADCVTTFTMSDFGRTLISNGNGSDHAWGGNVMVMGDDVNGGQVFGQYPSLALNGADDVGGAIMLPTTSVDEYFAELCRWFGVSNGDMNYVLPNIGNFYNVNSNVNPIGFMV